MCLDFFSDLIHPINLLLEFKLIYNLFLILVKALYTHLALDVLKLL